MPFIRNPIVLATGTGTHESNINTASITPSAGKPVFVAVGLVRSGGAPTPTVSGCGMTWTQVGTQTAASGELRITIFRGVSPSPSTGVLNIAYTFGSSIVIKYSVVEFQGVDAGGTNASRAVVQVVGNSEDSSSDGLFAATLAAFSGSRNGVLAAVYTNATVGFAPNSASFTELADDATTHTIQLMWASTNQTNVPWTHTGTIALCGLAIELRAARAGGAIFAFL